MNNRTLALPVALRVLLAVVACAGSACRVGFAQSPVTADSGWTLVPGRGVPNPYTVHVRSGTAADAANNPAESHSTPAGSTLARLGIVGSLTHDAQDPTDEFRYAMAYQRDFTINESATIHLSNMLDGLFTFGGGGGGNNLPAGMIAELTVLRRTAHGAYVATGITATLNASGNVAGLPGRTGARAVGNLLRLASGDLDFAQADQ
ncbi:MAG TPA: hypothetical protein VEB22_03870, partial [Phycisphaerales bacterium]|nr:hypothetical protein [Phycisphaerales bacterium]